jgi:hypothetical protein
VPASAITKTQITQQITVQQWRVIQQLRGRIVSAVEAFRDAGRADDLGTMVVACKRVVSTATYAERFPLRYGPLRIRWHAAMGVFVQGGERFLNGLNAGHVIFVAEADTAFRTGIADSQIAIETAKSLRTPN